MFPFPSLRVTLSYILFFIASVVAGPPTISLSYGTFQGLSDGNLTKFLGVPFAQSGRFEVPKAPGLLRGLQNATAFGPACPQQALTPLRIPFASASYPSVSENCHTLDIFKPSSPGSGYRLPVFIWLYGGAFEVGNSRDTDVSPVVERSVQTGEPIIIVVPNYRLSAFGFLAGKEVRAAGVTNLGLRDQIFALEWVQKYISAFGGDPNRVVIGGQSAGAISTALLLLSNNRNSNALFRGAFMESGSPIGSPSPAVLQSHYDALVAANNCSADTETLSCLRRVPFDSFMATVNRTADIFSYQSLALVWQPYVDSDVVARDPLVSVTEGLYAKIPLMTGDSDDEGTVFAFSNQNITTDAEFLDYVHYNYLPTSTPEQIAEVGRLYPEDPAQGSPFDTGSANARTPEYKRISAFQGDFQFTGPRRFFLEHASHTQDTWSWLNKRGKDASPLGAFHVGDTQIWFTANTSTTGETVGVDALINFINTLNPNRPAHSSSNSAHPAIFWPKWRNTSTPESVAGSPALLTFTDAGINITAETFRIEAIGYLNSLRFAK